MLLYDFQCVDCGRVFESLVNNSEVFLVQCPNCEGVSRRLICAPATQTFKSGFQKPPLLDNLDSELDPKKKDIFGRRFDELSDDLNIESRMWKKAEEKLGPDCTKPEKTEERLHIQKEVFDKNAIKKTDGVKS